MKTQAFQIKSDDVAGLIKQGCGGRECGRDIGAHPHKLGTLTRKYKSNFTHLNPNLYVWAIL
jgi:hypothetical protein